MTKIEARKILYDFVRDSKHFGAVTPLASAVELILNETLVEAEWLMSAKSFNEYSSRLIQEMEKGKNNES